MIEGPHIFGFWPVAFCISLTSALASARLDSSGSAAINAATLSWVGLVLLSAIFISFEVQFSKHDRSLWSPGTGRRLGNWLLRRGESIAYPWLGQHIAGLGRVRLDFLPKLIDEHSQIFG